MGKRKGHGARPRRGELPNEYLRQSLVTVSQFAVLEAGELRIQETSQGKRIPGLHYIVKTTRLDNEWRVEVEHQGVLTILPGKVVEQILRHRESIQKAQRRDRAVERATTLIKGQAGKGVGK